MIAFVKTGRGPAEAALAEVAVREPGPGEVLLRVAACGICGSDLHAYNADPGYEWVTPPVVLGHECSGVVAAVGAGVQRFRPGDRVVPISIQGCMGCGTCRKGETHLCPERRVMGLSHDGAMSSHAVVGEPYLVALPEDLDAERAALAEPLSVAVHAVSRAGVRPGEQVVVSGPGPIGLLSALVAARCGAQVLLSGVERDEAARLPAARRLGLHAVNTDRTPVDAALKGRPHRWIEASGSTSALEAAIRLVRPGGTIAVVGLYRQDLALALNRAARDELTVAFSYASTYRDYETALELLRQPAFDLEAVVRRYPLREAPKAFEDALAGRIVKALLIP